jgi:hypothetical protein
MDILIGIFLVVFGVVIAFVGIQVFFAVLPIVGFIGGFYVGAAGVEALFGDGFLSTVTGWVAGIVVGLLFAWIAWYWWYAGVLIAATASGALLATTLASAIGVDSSFILFLFGIFGAAGVAFLALMVNLPVYVAIINTAIVGAAIVMNGFMLIFNQVDTEQLEEGFAVVMTDVSWWWVLGWAAVAAVGVGRQLTLKEQMRLPSDRWTQAGWVSARP